MANFIVMRLLCRVNFSSPSNDFSADAWKKIFNGANDTDSRDWIYCILPICDS